MFKCLRQFAHRVGREFTVYRRVWRDPRTPWLPRILLGLAIAYFALPFDLIPDFIPVFGQLDDLLIVPLLVWLAVRLIPPAVLAEHRAAVLAMETPEQGRPSTRC
ncbi:MAG TPA: YkvA family protein [Opitutaceae bacterium]|nr:YkvA family protein [Opitutaceae bacterium]